MLKSGAASAAGEDSTKPIDIQKKYLHRKQRYRSPDQVELSPRSIIAAELAESRLLETDGVVKETSYDSNVKASQDA